MVLGKRDDFNSVLLINKDVVMNALKYKVKF